MEILKENPYAQELAEVKEALEPVVHHLTADPLTIRSPGLMEQVPGGAPQRSLNEMMKNAGVNRKGRRAYLAVQKAQKRA